MVLPHKLASNSFRSHPNWKFCGWFARFSRWGGKRGISPMMSWKQRYQGTLQINCKPKTSILSMRIRGKPKICLLTRQKVALEDVWRQFSNGCN